MVFVADPPAPPDAPERLGAPAAPVAVANTVFTPLGT